MLIGVIGTICESLSCITYRGDQHTEILIQETDKKAKLKKITLTTSNGNWLSFAPDMGRKKSAQMSPLLATGTTQKHHCACDTVILHMDNDHLTVIYIDLKSDNPVGYANQFKSTRQFVRYLFGLIEEFHGKKISSFEERYVIFHTSKQSSLDKRTTVPNASKLKNTKPDEAYKKAVPNGATVYLKELLS